MLLITRSLQIADFSDKRNDWRTAKSIIFDCRQRLSYYFNFTRFQQAVCTCIYNATYQILLSANSALLLLLFYDGTGKFINKRMHSSRLQGKLNYEFCSYLFDNSIIAL